MSMVYFREGQLQRRFQKITGSENQPAQDDEAMSAYTIATFRARNARMHRCPQKEGQDQLDHTEDSIYNQPTPD
jgi:hypothetical protein